jgi:hypothetical protein
MIQVPTIPADGLIAFVDEAIHHMTPHYGHRAVKAGEFAALLKKEFGEATFREARDAYQAFVAENSTLSGMLWSIVSTPEPYAAYLTTIPATQAPTWFNWIELTGNPRRDLTRADLFDAGTSNQLIDKLLAESKTWAGYQQVTIPKAQLAPAANAPLKRQMSENALKDTVPLR